VSGSGAQGKVGDEKGVVVEDGEGGEEGVWSVKRSGGKEDFEGGGWHGDDGDSIKFVEMEYTGHDGG